MFLILNGKIDRKCQNCNTNLQLEVHHIKSVKNFPELRHSVDNGIILCHNCHYYGVHSGKPNYINGKSKSKSKSNIFVELKEELKYLKGDL